MNWDPIEKTVLANEQVINGKGWRSNAVVERKKLSQWFFNITKFSDQLLNDLDNLDGWPDKVKLMQKNWIGKSIGCELDFKIEDLKKNIRIFTTRPDTIFGASFIAISLSNSIITFFNWIFSIPDIISSIIFSGSSSRGLSDVKTENELLFTAIKPIFFLLSLLVILNV